MKTTLFFQNREHAQKKKKKKNPFYAKFRTIMRTGSQYRATTPGADPDQWDWNLGKR